MRLLVQVTAKARQEKVEKLGPDNFKVWVRAVPEQGRANERVTELLAEYFDRPKNLVTIVSGQNSRKKLVEIS